MWYERPDNIQSAVDYPEIYIRKVLKRGDGSSVRDSRHACIYCYKLFHHVGSHLRDCHNKDLSATEVEDLQKKGDQRHNRKVMTCKKGELLVSRRPVGAFFAADYGACPGCYDWVHNVVRHARKCQKIGSMSNNQVRGASQLISMDQDSQMSEALVLALGPMKNDLKPLVQADPLIKELGKYWLAKNSRNELNCERYARQHMRFAARFLLEMRHQIGDPAAALADTLKPCFFNHMLEAARVLSGSEKDFVGCKAASNAIRLGQDIKHMVERLDSLETQKVDRNEELITNLDHIKKLLKSDWNTFASRRARQELLKKKTLCPTSIPPPDDVEAATRHLQRELGKFSPTENHTRENFNHWLKMAMARLLLFNKRRSGEIEALT